MTPLYTLAGQQYRCAPELNPMDCTGCAFCTRDGCALSVHEKKETFPDCAEQRVIFEEVHA